MNLKDLAKSKGTNVKRLAERCGVPASTLYAISSGETNIENVGIDVFLKIADGLGMCAEDLRMTLSDGIDYGVVSLSGGDIRSVGDEAELLSLYRRMVDEDKRTFMEMARALAFAGDAKKKDAPRAECGTVDLVS